MSKKDEYMNLSINERINVKSWYYEDKLDFDLFLRVNKVFRNAPSILTFCGIAQYDCPYGKYKKGARLDGVTDTSIFAAS